MRSALALLALPLLLGAGTEQEPPLDSVLVRAASYVVAFQRQLSGIVAEESYSQQVRSRRWQGPSRRLLKSDFLLVLPEGSTRYVEFRDVFEVDGRPVRDRQDRLTTLFLDPAAASGPQLESIIFESARYNIGNFDRTLNTPMLALAFLLPEFQARFQFSRTPNVQPDVPSRVDATFRVNPAMVAIEFRETAPETFIRTPDGGDFPARGRFWIDPATGAVLMSELVMVLADMRVTIDVSYQSEPLLGFRVPVAMREQCQARGEYLEGLATYGRFRQFRVRTDAEIAPAGTPAKPPPKPPGL